MKLMKNLIIIIGFLASSNIYSQTLKIKWEDNQGREFSINAPDGELNFGSIAGDNIIYNSKGQVQIIGNVSILYNSTGKPISIGNVSIIYDYKNRISSIGGLSIHYDSQGKITGSYGKVK